MKPIPNTDDRYYATEDGKIYDKKLNKFTSITKNKRGWLKCHVWINRERKTVGVHRLVASAYLGESNLTVNHKDGNKENNHISNLEYATVQEQNIHRSQVIFKGNQRPVICLENNVVYHSAAEAARMLGLNDYSHICHVCQHRYGHRTVGGYHFEYYKEQ